MKESGFTVLESVIRAFISSNEKEIVEVLYKITEPVGNFTRRFIFCDEGKNYILHRDGLREEISREQIDKLLELSEQDKFYCGGVKCHLHQFDNKKENYFIVDNTKTMEAEKIAFVVSALFEKLREIKKSQRKEEIYSFIGNFIKEAEEISGEYGSIDILQSLNPLLTELFSPATIIIGTRKTYFFEVAAKTESGEKKVFPLSGDISFLIGRRFEEYSEDNKRFFVKCESTFGVKCGKFLVSIVKFLGKFPEIFVVISSDKVPDEEATSFLERAATLFLFLRKIKALEESEKNLVDYLNLVAKKIEIQRKVFNSIRIGILVLSKEGKIFFYNSNSEKLLNLTRVEQKEKFILSSKEPGKTIMALVSRVAEEGKLIAVPLKIFDRIVDVEVLEMEKGVFLVVCEDSTSLYSEMEERKHLFSLITHEIKNPLASVLSASEMLHSERAGKFETREQKKLSEILYRNARQMREILEDVSLYGKSLFGIGEQKVVSIKSLIEKILEEKKDISNAKEIVLHREIMDISMKCNPAMMETLLSNLIGNALKYSPVKGNVGIRALLFANAILIEVLDDGVGIPEKDLKRIGEPFFRAENVRDNIAGTGFGLSIVKSIALRHQGKFKVFSPITEEDRIFLQNPAQNCRGAKFVVTFSLGGGENDRTDSGGR